ncbi:cupredoxin domain-containing protein [Rhodovulum sp. YNF3179]|uniref:cupredoxin domain-containing protein n=1 Tax=Rhodovulum sp. YNF3179 TaxID=3425127 RepID=UPI003D33A32D
MNKITPRALGAALLTTCLAATAAQSAGSHAGGHGHSEAEADIGTPAATSAANREVRVSMGEMFFEPARIDVEQGETVRFVVTNAGDFVHEFALGTAAMHGAHAAEMSRMMEAGVIGGGQIHHDMMEEAGMMHQDPNSLLLEPGETGTLTWTFDGDAALELSCNVPGHRESGMQGELRLHEARADGS